MLKRVQPKVNMNPNAGLRNCTYFHLFKKLQGAGGAISVKYKLETRSSGQFHLPASHQTTKTDINNEQI